MGTRLSENELQKSLDFCADVFTPTTPEQVERITASGRISKDLLDMTASVLSPAVVEEAMRVQNGTTASTYPPLGLYSTSCFHMYYL